MLAKQGWRLVSNPTSLIARLYKALYYPGGSFLDADRYGPSFSWRSILEARPVLQSGLLWKMGSGTNITIGHDNWIPKYFAHSSTAFELPCSVSGRVDQPVNQTMEYQSTSTFLSSRGCGIYFVHSLECSLP